MAYTNAWNETQPLGSAAANTIDDIIRQLKVDIRERMNTVLNSDGLWDADPIKLKGQTGRVLMLSGASFVPTSTASFTSSTFDLANDGSISTDAPVICCIPIRSEWRITGVDLIVNRNASPSLTCSLVTRSFSTTSTPSTIATQSVVSAGKVLVALYSGSTIIGISDTLNIKVSPPSGPLVNFLVYGARITYSEY